MIYAPDGTPAHVKVKVDQILEFERRLAAQLEHNDGQLFPPRVMENLVNALDARGEHRKRAQEEHDRPSNSAMRPIMDEYDDKVKDTRRGPILISIPARKV